MGCLVNVKRHHLAESLMDACINKGAAQHQEAERLLDVLNRFDIFLQILSFSKSRKYGLYRSKVTFSGVLQGTQSGHVERCIHLYSTE